MKTVIHKQMVIYHNCIDCPFFLTPDEEGKVILKGDNGHPNTITFSSTVISPDGEHKPNPMKGVCGVLGHHINDTEHPIRISGNGEGISAYHTPDGNCIIEHIESTTRLLIP